MSRGRLNPPELPGSPGCGPPSGLIGKGGSEKSYLETRSVRYRNAPEERLGGVVRVLVV